MAMETQSEFHEKIDIDLKQRIQKNKTIKTCIVLIACIQSQIEATPGTSKLLTEKILYFLESEISSMAELLLLIARNLAEKQVAEDGRNSKLSLELQELRDKIPDTFRALEEAERRQLDDEGPRKWLADIKDACYDVIDVFDEWDLLQMKLQRQEQVGGLSCSSLSFLNPIRQYMVRDNRAPMIKNLVKKMELVRGDIPHLAPSPAFNEGSWNRDEISNEGSRNRDEISNEGRSNRDEISTTTLQGNYLPDEGLIIGLDSEKGTLMSKLISESSQQQGIYYLSIVGQGGSGKSTLAELVYKSEEVQNHFELKAWVLVDQNFNLVRILKTIIESITGETYSRNEAESEILIQRCREIIRGKRYLFVLDNVCKGNGFVWVSLKRVWECGAPGSTILITTRNVEIAHHVESADIMKMKTLSEEDSWFLFRQLAFPTDAEIETPKEEVGRQVVNYCGGVPLAIKMLARFLRNKTSVEDWEATSKKLGLAPRELTERSWLSVLMVSYCQLRPALRQCFLYCSIFPNDHPIDVEKLIRLWMAQGYLASEENDMEIEGNHCYKELLSRSLFRSNRDHIGNLLCGMHELILELIRRLAEKECSVIHVDSKKEAEKVLSSQKGRHWTIYIVDQASLPIFVRVPEKVLTLMIISEHFSIDPTSLSNLLCRFKRLRALDMSHCLIRELPLLVGKLLHLRYLDLSYNGDLKELPEAICDLFLLQTLNLNGCDSLRKLPNRIGKLIFLRHLELLWTKCLSYLPKGIGSLTSLRTLSRFFGGGIDSSMACNLGDLGKLNCLQGYISIDGLGCVTDVALAEKADLKDKEGLRSVELWFTGVGSDQGNDVLKALQPPTNLKSLGIFYYRGTSFPHWIQVALELRHIMLSDCSGCEILPPLGKLPFLESVEVRNMINLKKIGLEFLGIESGCGNDGKEVFPQLKKLHFHNLTNWVEWDEITGGVENVIIMPTLGSLSILKCTKIKAVPIYIKKIKNLSRHIEECQKLEWNWED